MLWVCMAEPYRRQPSGFITEVLVKAVFISCRTFFDDDESLTLLQNCVLGALSSFTHQLISFLQQSHESDTVILPILQINT